MKLETGNLKQDKKAGHIPIIVLTAIAMKGDREKVMDAGCDDYPNPLIRGEGSGEDW